MDSQLTMANRFARLLHNLKSRSGYVLCVLLCGIGLNSCDSTAPKDASRMVSTLDLLEFNEQNAKIQAMLLDSMATEWGWSAEGSYSKNGSGVHVVRRELIGQRRRIHAGDTLYWTGRAMLLDSTVLFNWTAANPFSMAVEASNWPDGFHELGLEMNAADSMSALIPPHMGWGLSGLPPLVPQEAAIWFELAFHDLRPVLISHPASRQKSDSDWNAWIDAFEKGHVKLDSDWLKSPYLVGGTCISWFDSSQSSSTAAFLQGTRVEIAMRTFRPGFDGQSSADFGWNRWSFQVGDDDQVLPVIEQLMRQHPKRDRWECHCRVSDAFGPDGLPQLGLLPEDVVGFQWEWAHLDEGTL